MCSFFTYNLPERSIAQYHAAHEKSRDSSRLLVLRNSADGFEISDHYFSEVENFFESGDVLVLNDTRVINARFFGKTESGIEIEVLLIEQISDDASEWLALSKPMKKCKPGIVVSLSDKLKLEVLERTSDKRFLKVKLSKSNTDISLSLNKLVELDGSSPIPPYIRNGRSNENDKLIYQTTYADNPGSVAAPTAGLHFTDELLLKLKSRGVHIEYVTLHVGPGSFLPIDDIENEAEITVQEERYFVSSKTWDLILNKKESRKKIIAVGTTVVRTLETLALSNNPETLIDKWNKTDLFIKEGFKFKLIDSMFTNFHQPKSTHLQLVAAFIGREAISKVYNHALNNNYRFLSYGDSSYLEKKKSNE